jgi:hypothetical protein
VYYKYDWQFVDLWKLCIAFVDFVYCPLSQNILFINLRKMIQLNFECLQFCFVTVPLSSFIIYSNYDRCIMVFFFTFHLLIVGRLDIYVFLYTLSNYDGLLKIKDIYDTTIHIMDFLYGKYYLKLVCYKFNIFYWMWYCSENSVQLSHLKKISPSFAFYI